MYKISAEFEFGGHSPPGVHLQNVALGYNVGKISAVCVVFADVYLVDGTVFSVVMF